MLCGGTLVSTCILSYFMLRRKIQRHHLLGMVFAIIGYLLVGLSTIINGDALAKYSFDGLIIGILMILCSNFTQGFLANVEELLLNRYEIDPQRMTGLEGFYGMIWIFLGIVIATNIPCPNPLLCDVISSHFLKFLTLKRWEDLLKTQ